MKTIGIYFILKAIQNIFVIVDNNNNNKRSLTDGIQIIHICLTSVYKRGKYLFRLQYNTG